MPIAIILKKFRIKSLQGNVPNVDPKFEVRLCPIAKKRIKIRKS